MIVFPNCKINIGLHITGKRADGYHNIETCFYPVKLNDALEIIDSTVSSSESTPVFTLSGLPVQGNQNDNLCLKAWQLLKKEFPHLPAVQIHLHKAIPMGAGLGGGSADAAFTLLALNEKFVLNLTPAELITYALQLGSDCPFFILNTACIATGRGELMQPISLSLSGYHLLLVNPGIHINTQWAFSQININSITANSAKKESLQTIISQSIEHSKENVINDFEEPVFEKYPAVKAIKETLYNNGALFASMSGSGSTVYGIFKDVPPTFDFPETYFLRSILL